MNLTSIQRHASHVLEAMYRGQFCIEVVTVYASPSDETNTEETEPLSDPLALSDQESGYQKENACQKNNQKDEFSGEIKKKGRGRPRKIKTEMCQKPKKFKLPTAHKITRPPNSFMIFASEFRRVLAKTNPEKRNKVISKLLGNTWRQLPQEEKRRYELKAIAAAQEHKRLYPTYVYNPQEARLRKAQREQTKLAMRAQRQRKNSLSHSPDQQCSPPPLQHLLRHSLQHTSPSPLKVLHQESTSASVREQVMRGMPPPGSPTQAYATPPRFYPNYEQTATSYQPHHYQQSSPWYPFSQQQQQQHHLHQQQQQHHHQQQQLQPNSSYGVATHGRSMMAQQPAASYASSVAPYMQSPEHQGLLLPGGTGEEEEHMAAMPPQAMSQYEVVPPTPPQQTKVETSRANNPDSQPLPPFQHAFGSTEIGRYAHEGFSAQVRAPPPPSVQVPTPLQTAASSAPHWGPRHSMQQFPLHY